MIGYNHIEDIPEYQYIDTLLAGDAADDAEELELPDFEDDPEEILGDGGEPYGK